MTPLKEYFLSGLELKYMCLPQDGSNGTRLKHPLGSRITFHDERKIKLDHADDMTNTGKPLCIFIHY